MKKTISTDQAPSAIGPYSQAVRTGNTVYVSGQIPLHPQSMQVVEGDIQAQAQQAFSNLIAICQASGGQVGHIVKLTIYLTDMNDFAAVNEVMQQHFTPPYPARAAIGVNALPKGVAIEIEAILALDQ